MTRMEILKRKTERQKTLITQQREYTVKMMTRYSSLRNRVAGLENQLALAENRIKFLKQSRWFKPWTWFRTKKEAS